MLKNLPNWLQRLAPQSGAGLKLSPQQRQELLAALASQRTADRWLAAEALAEGDPGREGVAALASLLSDPDPLLRFEAARGLGQIGGKAARQALLAAAGSEDARVQAAAADGLGSLPASAESVAALAGLLESRDAAVRQSAGEALARLDPLPPARDGSSAAPAIQAALLRLLAEDDAMLVRRAAALALTRWGEGGGGGDTTADGERNTTADENGGWGAAIRCSHPLWYSDVILLRYPAACANATAPRTPAMLPRPGGTM